MKDLMSLKQDYRQHYGWELEGISKVEFQDFSSKEDFALCLNFRDGKRRIIFNSSTDMSKKLKIQLAHLCSITKFHLGTYVERLYP